MNSILEAGMRKRELERSLEIVSEEQKTLAKRQRALEDEIQEIHKRNNYLQQRTVSLNEESRNNQLRDLRKHYTDINFPIDSQNSKILKISVKVEPHMFRSLDGSHPEGEVTIQIEKLTHSIDESELLQRPSEIMATQTHQYSDGKMRHMYTSIGYNNVSESLPIVVSDSIQLHSTGLPIALTILEILLSNKQPGQAMKDMISLTRDRSEDDGW